MSSTLLDAQAPRVLLVEDTRMTRNTISQILAPRGYLVTEAGDGREALDVLGRTAIDAIVLDLVMPRMDGWQFRKEQLRRTELAGIPTLVASVQPLTPFESYALRAPSIRKPFDADQLIEALGRVCRKTLAAAAPSGGPGSAATGSAATGSAATRLFWSRRGEVACAEHAPAVDGDTWRAERWSAITDAPRSPRPVYQCQYCGESQGPIRHPRKSEDPKRRSWSEMLNARVGQWVADPKWAAELCAFAGARSETWCVLTSGRSRDGQTCFAGLQNGETLDITMIEMSLQRFPTPRARAEEVLRQLGLH